MKPNLIAAHILMQSARVKMLMKHFFSVRIFLSNATFPWLSKKVVIFSIKLSM